jgi:excisionase family DNA binding protein
MKPTGTSRLLDLPTLATEYGGLTYAGWYALIQRGEIPVIRPGTRRRLLVQRQDVERWLVSHTVRVDERNT